MSDSKNRPPQTQDCSCTATPAAAGSLADLLLEVPLIMEIMDDKSWSAVSACSRQLRQLVQSKTRVVHAYIPIDINLLIKHTRAGLCLICQGDYHADVFGHGMLWPENDALELEAVITFTDRPHEAQVLMVKPTSHQREDQLACHTNHLHQWTQRRNWTTDKVTGMQQNSTGAKEMAQLNALGLPPIRKLQIAVGHLDKAAITHLVAGNFRFLFQLNLSNNNLDAATLQLLAKGSWHHLEVLNLSGNKLDKETMSHLCANGWPLHVSSCLRMFCWLADKISISDQGL